MHTTVSDVHVDRDPDGTLLVTWRLDGPDGDVDIAFGTRPDRIDHDAALRATAGVRSLRLDVPATSRTFVSVSPADGGSALVGAERRVPFEGVSNFRDLGGYRTADGGRTRWGRVFRSDGFHALTDADRRLFTDLGLRVVYDLRSVLEREAKPNLLPDDAALRSVELVLSSGEDEHGALPPVEQLSAGDDFLVGLYLGLVEEAAPVFGSLLTGLAEPDGLPAVFHCRFGKDRTGMAAAILLTALGVPQADVVEDYELTGRYQEHDAVAVYVARLEDAGVPKEAAAGLLGAPAPVMAAVLDEILGRYGDVEQYLLGPAGMRQETLTTLRRRLVA
jgi:protein-tyrosine phosphatase